MAGKKEDAAHVRRQKSVEARDQPEKDLDDITGFHERQLSGRDNPGDASEQEHEDEVGDESTELTTQSGAYGGRESGASSELALYEPHDMTPYVASCAAHVETLRKRKREQEERVEALVQESFGHVEAIMNYLAASLQQSHAASRAEFDTVDAKISQSLDVHNRIEKKMKMIAAILLHGHDGLAADE